LIRQIKCHLHDGIYHTARGKYADILSMPAVVYDHRQSLLYTGDILFIRFHIVKVVCTGYPPGIEYIEQFLKGFPISPDIAKHALRQVQLIHKTGPLRMDNGHEGVPHKIDYRQVTLPQILAANIGNYPDRTALLFLGFRLSYAGLGEMIDRFAAALAGFGITKGDRVVIVLPNTIPCVAAYHATLKLGAVVVMNNPLYHRSRADPPAQRLRGRLPDHPGPAR
jgi:hypothetical protein